MHITVFQNLGILFTEIEPERTLVNVPTLYTFIKVHCVTIVRIDGKYIKDLDTKIAEAIAKAVGGLTAEDGVIGKLTGTVNTFINTYNEREKSARESAIREQLKEYIGPLVERWAELAERGGE